MRMQMQMQKLHLHILTLLLHLYYPHTSAGALSVGAAAPSPPSLLPPDAVALLSFQAKADLDYRLRFALNERFDFCHWRGVRCAQGRVVRLALPSAALRGAISPDSLPRLAQLRVLTLRNNSLSGPIPDLSPLPNLKTLILARNAFSGRLPPSLPSLRRLQALDLSRNNLTGPIPAGLASLDRLIALTLNSNRLDGAVPPLNQSSLLVFNVSANNLTGPIPAALSRFGLASFSANSDLCGQVINRPCPASSRPPPFFGPTRDPPASDAQVASSSPPATAQSRRNKHRTGLILGFCAAFSVMCISVVIFVKAFNRRERDLKQPAMAASDIVDAAAEDRRTGKNGRDSGEMSEGVGVGIQAQRRARRSGSLVFCVGESEVFSLEQLMRASAEMLGRGTIGTTYKAVMDERLIVSVKRFDATKMAATSPEAFDRHMEAVGGLRHPNLVPVRAYFQAKDERLVVYDYQPNGSLFSLIHGSRSARARPLHWTSCLKIAEDVAQGLAYIHQASRLIHGNLKSSNVLLGADFESCLTDYCLAVLADHPLSNDDPDTARYRAPETRESIGQATPKSDVYTFGVLLLEILTGKPPAEHPFLIPPDMPDWVRAMREDDNVEHGEEEDGLDLLVEVAGICCKTSPEQRPAMRRVLKMIQEIKESLMVEGNNAALRVS